MISVNGGSESILQIVNDFNSSTNLNEHDLTEAVPTDGDLKSLKCDSIDSLNNNSHMSDQDSNNQRDSMRQRKIIGLLKLIQEKNQQIESLKYEINEVKPSSSLKPLAGNSVRILLESLEKEVQIYQKLNSTQKNSDLKSNLQEVIKLRNELLRATILKENQPMLSTENVNINGFLSPRSLAGDADNLSSSSGCSGRRSRASDNIGGSNSGSSSSSDWQRDSMPDSGLASQKSDANLAMSDSSSSKAIAMLNSNRKSINSSCIPRPIGSTTSSASSSADSSSPRLNNRTVIRSASNCSKLADLTYKNYAREQLIHLIQKVDNENSIIKRQLESKLRLKSKLN